MAVGGRVRTDPHLRKILRTQYRVATMQPIVAIKRPHASIGVTVRAAATSATTIDAA